VAPRVAHVAKDHKVHERPQSGKRHVQNDKVLPSLYGGHLLEKPLSDEKPDGRDKRDDPDERREVARAGVLVHDADLLVLLLKKEPSRRRDAAKNDDGEEQGANPEGDDGPLDKRQGILGSPGFGPSEGASITPLVHHGTSAQCSEHRASSTET